MIEAIITARVTADEDDLRTLVETAGKTERVYIVTAGMFGHIEIDSATYTEDYEDNWFDHGGEIAAANKEGNAQ